MKHTRGSVRRAVSDTELDALVEAAATVLILLALEGFLMPGFGKKV
jgi:hypothetical protein